MRSSRRRGAVALTAGILLAVASGACGAPRNTLNTSASACFRGLSLAVEAVANRGELVGVRRVHASALAEDLPSGTDVGQGVVCAVAFQGDFANAAFTHAEDGGPARYALVILDGHGSAVRFTYVLSRLPIRFHHRT